MLSIGAGTGLLYLLRWFWWRINAWSEIAAMASSFVLAIGLLVLERNGTAIPPHLSLVITVVITTAVWLAATWLTAPTDEATLRRFYTLARPAGPGWTAVRQACGHLPPGDALADALVGALASCVFVYSALFGVGLLLLGRELPAAVAGITLLASGVVMGRSVRRMWSR